MRLIEVEIENYKQYAGVHRFEPGEKAMVAVVGQNGAGKTTLFEAIEWCLYNPSRIRNDTLTPRVQGGKPRVRVVLEDPHTGIVYEIERMLKGASTQAEIYRQDQPESPLVQGTKQVTEYVARELTGLSHAAFVSTFFTRQKELSFFGELGPTQRREQVGRLLGLETIRVAQKRIGEQRTGKQAEAKVKRAQYEEQSSGIDFPAERARLDLVITEQAALRDSARELETSCKTATAVASKGRDLAQERFAANAGLQQELARVAGEQRRLAELRDAAQRDLTAIAQAEEEIGRQQVHAANELALRAALDTHAAEKTRRDDVNRLTADRQQLLDDRQHLVDLLPSSAGVAEAAASGSVYGATALVAAFDTEIGRLALADPDAIRSRRDALHQLLATDTNRAAAETRLESMQRHAANLAGELADLTNGGTPAERIVVLETERAALQQAAAAATSVAKETERRARDLQTLERNLRESELGEICPTCARPFQPGEADRTLLALSEQVRLLDDEVGAGRAAAKANEAQAATIGASIADLRKENDAYQVLVDRIENGRRLIAEQGETVEALTESLELQMTAAQRVDVPGQSEIDRLTIELERAEADARLRPRLEVGRDQLRQSIERQEQLELRLTDLGEARYDEGAHRRDHAAWSIARDAAARIEELQKQVARRPERETAREQAIGMLAELDGERVGVELGIADLGFDPIEQQQANAVFAQALDQERAATEAAHTAEQQVDKAQRQRDELDAFQQRLQALAAESAAADVSAGELDRVYREFARFEQYVAIAVTPVLGESASELLDTATDGKYGRLEFTEDYGIEVYDGQDDRFPLGQFSGGERDVIALCARLALSQVIGGQAATPIQFMVLDEVFGSLDLDRRRNLMEMLQRLVEENQAFQQLFVISHVDDVRAGSMFDEVWKVTESTDGISQLEHVSATGAPEDY